MAYVFNYMGPNPAHASLIEKAWPEGGESGYTKVQSIGPSPVVIHRKDLEAMAEPWEKTAVHLKTDPAADARLGRTRRVNDAPGAVLDADARRDAALPP